LKIVIPMSGVGQRFRDAGYKDPKPLIQVDGKPIIEHVVAMFPGEADFTFVCSRDHLESTGLRAVLTRIAPAGRIVAIEPHKLGPVHAVLQAADTLPDDEPVVVNYCDFAVDWDWPAIKAAMAANGCDGAVPAYRGFHPHMLGDTHYAFMRDDHGWMLEIQEKKPFTANRMDEYASTGTYCFRRGALLTPVAVTSGQPFVVAVKVTSPGINYPIAIDSNYEIWGAFSNHYWPALYFLDREGVLRDQHFGEGRYDPPLYGVSSAPGDDRYGKATPMAL